MRLSAICEVTAAQRLPTDPCLFHTTCATACAEDEAQQEGHFQDATCYDKNKKYPAPQTHQVQRAAEHVLNVHLDI